MLKISARRNGEPAAAIVPIWQYRQWETARNEFFESLNAAADRADLTPEEAENLALEAVAAVRAERCRET